MRSIRKKLFLSSIVIIAVFFAVSAFYAIEGYVFVKQYESITNTMFNAYEITQNTTDMVNIYNILIQSINDPQEIAQYQGYKNTIKGIFAQLDTVITNQNTKVAYLGLKNTVNGVVAKLDYGVQAAQSGNIAQESADYDTALQQNYFVQQNTANLILNELQNSQQLQASIARSQMLAELIGGLLLLLVTAAAVFYSVIFSRNIVFPIKALSTLAKKIEEGDLEALIDPLLLEGTDEVGSLANSFNAMFQALKSSIRELDIEKKSVEAKVKQRTQELMQERAQLLASINSLPLGFILLDTAGGVLLSNNKIHELSSREDSTFVSISGQFVPAIDILEFDRQIKEKQNYELSETTLGERSFHIIGVPVILSRHGESETIIGSVVLFEDITKEKRLEQSKDTFLAMAAHEMRTPLTIIRGNAELLLDEPAVGASAGLKVQIESMLRSTIRLLAIVNDFLDVQNLEGGRMSLKIETADIIALLTETVKDLLPLAQKKGLALTLTVPPDFGTPIFAVDKYRLQQIFTNLISNAIHYTEKGSVTIVPQKKEKQITILFEDTGIGISAEEQERLFKKFEVGRVFMRSKEYGSGLGLYIARFLARLMGGVLTLEKSEIGKGSTFCLTVPLGDVFQKQV